MKKDLVSRAGFQMSKEGVKHHEFSREFRTEGLVGSVRLGIEVTGKKVNGVLKPVFSLLNLLPN
jgi:hypothetical protein